MEIPFARLQLSISSYLTKREESEEALEIGRAHKATHGEQYFSTVAMRETGSGSAARERSRGGDGRREIQWA